jgi:hypothetical protein
MKNRWDLSKIFRTFRWTVLCPLLIGNCFQSAGVEYKGQITWNLLRNGAEVITNVYSVVAFADTNRVSITVSGESGENSETEEISIEDGESYFVRSRWPSWRKKRENQEQTQFAVVDSEDFPSRAHRVTQLVWMALADAYATNMITPSIFPSQLDSYLDRSRVTCLYFPSPGGEIPARIEGKAEPFVQVQGREFRLSGTAANGFTAWSVSISKSPFNNPQSIKAEFQQYFPVEVVREKEYRPEIIYKAVCILAQTGKNGEFKKPTLLAGVKIFDNRFKDRFKDIKEKPFLTYRASNNTWLSRDAAQVQTNLANVKTAMVKYSKNKERKFMFFLLLAGFLATPAVWIAARQKKT